MQIFSHSPRQWAQTVIPDEEAGRFTGLRQEHDINPVFIHTSYLINCAAKTDELLRKSIEFLSYELANADKLGVEYVVLHTGSASGEDEEKARQRATQSIVKALGRKNYRARLLLENTAGERGDITSMITSLAEIIDICACEGIGGICVDTCHAFAAGYDLRTSEGVDSLLGEIDEYVGLDMLKLIHLNDSKKPVGSGVDRHEHIGKGSIGINGFKNFLSDKRIRSVPLILETPKKSEDDDKRNLKKILDILSEI
jgi:deoxyribonuclease-4